MLGAGLDAITVQHVYIFHSLSAPARVVQVYLTRPVSQASALALCMGAAVAWEERQQGVQHCSHPCTLVCKHDASSCQLQQIAAQ